MDFVVGVGQVEGSDSHHDQIVRPVSGHGDRIAAGAAVEIDHRQSGTDDLDTQREFALHPVEEELARDVAGVETNRLVAILLTNDVAKVVGAREGDQPGRDLVVRVCIHEGNTGVNVGRIPAENTAGREDTPTADNPGGVARIERDIAGGRIDRGRHDPVVVRGGACHRVIVLVRETVDGELSQRECLVRKHVVAAGAEDVDHRAVDLNEIG